MDRKILSDSRRQSVIWPRVLTYLVLTIIALLWVTPIYFSFLTAFKDMHDYANQAFYQLPARFAFFTNIAQVFKQYKFDDHIISSIFYMVGAGLLCIIFSCLAAYGIVRLKPRGAFLIFMIIYSGTIFPFQMYLIPLFKFYNNVGLYNTRLG